MDFQTIPVELSLHILEFADNPNIILVSRHFASLRNLYFDSIASWEKFIKTKDFRSTNPIFQKAFPFRYFMMCFENDMHKIIESLVSPLSFLELSEDEGKKAILFYNRWLGRKGEKERKLVPFHHDDFEIKFGISLQDCVESFFFGIGERENEYDCFAYPDFWESADEHRKMGFFSTIKKPKQIDHPCEFSIVESMFFFGAFGKADLAFRFLKGTRAMVCLLLSCYAEGAEWVKNKESVKEMDKLIRKKFKLLMGPVQCNKKEASKTILAFLEK